MPILPPSITAPYPIAESILNMARVRINDAIASLGGDILTDTQPFTQVMFNAAWHSLQEYLANKGFTRCKQEVVLSGIPATSNYDPAAQVSLSWSGYFDGTSYFIPPNAPVLPQDMILPLRLWERSHSGSSTASWGFSPMAQALDGLPSTQKFPANSWWEWREDAIYMPGSTIAEDIRMRYAAFLPDITTQGTTNWTQQPVPIMRCENAMSYYVAAEAAAPRADLDAETFLQKAEKAASMIMNREVMQKQRTTATRRPYGRRSGSSYGQSGMIL